MAGALHAEERATSSASFARAPAAGGRALHGACAGRARGVRPDPARPAERPDPRSRQSDFPEAAAANRGRCSTTRPAGPARAQEVYGRAGGEPRQHAGRGDDRRRCWPRPGRRARQRSRAPMRLSKPVEPIAAALAARPGEGADRAVLDGGAARRRSPRRSPISGRRRVSGDASRMASLEDRSSRYFPRVSARWRVGAKRDIRLGKTSKADAVRRQHRRLLRPSRRRCRRRVPSP
jgi:hypothetical protein